MIIILEGNSLLSMSLMHLYSVELFVIMLCRLTEMKSKFSLFVHEKKAIYSFMEINCGEGYPEKLNSWVWIYLYYIIR